MPGLGSRLVTTADARWLLKSGRWLGRWLGAREPEAPQARALRPGTCTDMLRMLSCITEGHHDRREGEPAHAHDKAHNDPVSLADSEL